MRVQADHWRGAAAGVLAAGLLLLWTLPGTAAQAGPAVRIGVVNMQQVLNNSQRGMAAKQKLDQERAARQKDLDARQQEVVKMQADLEKQAPVLSEQAKRDKSEQLQTKVRDIRRLAEDANHEFQKKLQEAEGEMTQDIIQVIQEYGKDQGYTIILERSMLPYASPGVDVTPEIIKRFDGKQK